MPKMITILLTEKSVRLYLRFFAIGMGISFATLIVNSSFRFMGVDLSEFKSLFLSILPLFLKDYIQTLIASGILFGAIGLLLSSAFFGNEKKFRLARLLSVLCRKKQKMGLYWLKVSILYAILLSIRASKLKKKTLVEKSLGFSEYLYFFFGVILRFFIPSSTENFSFIDFHFCVSFYFF